MKRWLATLLLVAAAIAPFGLLCLSRSERLIVHSWSPRIGPVSEKSRTLELTLDIVNVSVRLVNVLLDLTVLHRLAIFIDEVESAGNRYHTNSRGRVDELRLRGIGIKGLGELPGIEGFSDLKRLDLSGNPLQGTIDLSCYPALEELRLRDTEVAVLAGIEHLPDLVKVDVAGTPLKSLCGVSALKTADFSRTLITDLSCLDASSALQDLTLNGMDLANVKGLDKLTNLFNLSLADCSSVDLTQLLSLSHLLFLSLNNSDVMDLAPLSSLNHLWVLSIAGVPSADRFGSFSRLSDVVVVDTPVGEVNRETQQRLLDAPVPAELAVLFSVAVGAPPTIRDLLSSILLAIVLFCIGVSLFVSTPFYYVRRSIAVSLLRLGLTSVYILVLSLSSSAALLESLRQPWLFGLTTASLAGMLSLPWVVQARSLSYGRSSFVVATVFELLVPWLLACLPAGLLISHISVFGRSFVLGLFGLFLLCYLGWPVSVWELRLATLRRVLAGKGNDRGPLLTIPLALKPGNHDFIWPSDAIWRAALRKELGDDGSPLMALSTYGTLMLAHAKVVPSGFYGLGGIVIRATTADLDTATELDVATLTAWVRDAYRLTAAPIWMAGDWVDDAASGRALDNLDGILPYLSGLARWQGISKLGRVLTPTRLSPNDHLPEIIRDALRANEMISRAELAGEGMQSLLASAFTPVSRLVRSVFGHPNLVDRLDALVRAAETAAAFFSVVLIADHYAHRAELSGLDDERIDRALQRNLAVPSFASWESILSTFCRNPRSALATQLSRALASPGFARSHELRAMVEAVGGPEAVSGVPYNKMLTQRHVLSLIRSMRNITTAHGPLTEFVAPELYRLSLLTTVELLAALPWRATVCQAVKTEGVIVAYQGCLPIGAPLPTGSPLAPSTCWVSLTTEPRDAMHQLVDVSMFLYPLWDEAAIAVYAGEGRLVDPVSGVQLRGANSRA
jgi:hypothetical protein